MPAILKLSRRGWGQVDLLALAVLALPQLGHKTNSTRSGPAGGQPLGLWAGCCPRAGQAIRVRKHSQHSLPSFSLQRVPRPVHGL